jgi:quercetin dioxygenase-like cupin family protein
MLLREIFVYPGGRTSIHRHQVQHELNFIAGGTVQISLGADPNDMQEFQLDEGHHFHVPPRLFHAVRFDAAEGVSGCARFFEVIYKFSSAADIERAHPAVPGTVPRFFEEADDTGS